MGVNTGLARPYIERFIASSCSKRMELFSVFFFFLPETRIAFAIIIRDELQLGEPVSLPASRAHQERSLEAKQNKTRQKCLYNRGASKKGT